MAKSKTVFVCGACGYESAKWLGRCTQCQTWDSMEEVSAKLMEAVNQSAIATPATIQRLTEVSVQEAPRFTTGYAEFDRVLGGGVVPGSLVLLGGDPGIGKSTLLLQAAAHMGEQNTDKQGVLIVTGEESAAQVRLRAERIGALCDGIDLYPQTLLEQVEELIVQRKPKVAIVDSIQTLYTNQIPSSPGSVAQLREGAGRLMRLAKSSGTAIFLIGHVNKEGGIAGPRVLEHMVDTVLYLEGDTHLRYRVLRAVKNRFGSTNEIGLFDMRDAGMMQVENPSEMLLSPRAQQHPGSVVAATVEGTRAMLVEFQALVSPTAYANPRRMAAGFDVGRLNMLIAVLEKRVGLPLYQQDAYVNVAGGLKITEPAADLAVACALTGCLRDLALGQRIAVFGEIGLTGEIRPVNRAQARVAECHKLGIQKLVLPYDNAAELKAPEGLQLAPARTLREAFAALFAATADQ